MSQEEDRRKEFAADNGSDSAVSGDDLRVIAALEAYFTALEAGQPPQREAFLAEHTDIAEALAECLDGLEFVHAAGAQVGQNGYRSRHCGASAARMKGLHRSGTPSRDPGDPPSGETSPWSVQGMLPEQTLLKPLDSDLLTLPDAAEDRTLLQGVNSPRGYELLERLGRGGMGVVYKARQVALDRIVALKMIRHGDHTDAVGRQRFRTEAEAVARLQHPNIIQIYEVGEQDGLPFFSMEYCPGGSLADRIKVAPLLPAEAARLVELLARAMDTAHRKNILHRDLKPANVLLGEDGTPKVGDFGLAKKCDEVSQTHSGVVVGTPSYMAPEQAAGKMKELGPAADVYSLGAILYECLTGRPPFRAATMAETLRQVASDDPMPVRRLNSETPRDLETICLKCLRKEPANRYGSASELADDLGRYQRGESIRGRPVGVPERVTKWVRRHPAVAVLLAVVLLLACTTVVALIKAYQQAVTERNWFWIELQDARAETEKFRASEKQARESLERVPASVPPPSRPQGKEPKEGTSRLVAGKNGQHEADGKLAIPKGRGITIAFTATVAEVRDGHRLFDGSVRVGDKLTGSYTFDPLTPDTNDDATVGDYRHRDAGYGMQVQVGNYLFKTDPADVNFLLEVVNRPADHAYLLRSYNNLVFGPRLPEVCADHISWQLNDPRGVALASDRLPLDPPRLADWTSDFGLMITGGVNRNKGFLIRAHVVEVLKIQK